MSAAKNCSLLDVLIETRSLPALTHVLPPISTSRFAHLCRKRPRCSILAASLAALPSMSLIPFAPFLRANYVTASHDFPRAPATRFQPRELTHSYFGEVAGSGDSVSSSPRRRSSSFCAFFASISALCLTLSTRGNATELSVMKKT